MPFEKGHKRVGGRKKGTPNKTTRQWAEWVDQATALAGKAITPGLRRELKKMGVEEADMVGLPAPVAYLTKAALDAPNTFVKSIVAKRLPNSLDVGLDAPDGSSIEIKIVTGMDPSLGEPGEHDEDGDDTGPADLVSD